MSAATATCRRIGRIDPAFRAAVMILLELRTNLDAATATAAIDEQARAHGYELHGIFDQDRLVGVGGFRVVTTLARGRHLHLDDLVVIETSRGGGYGRA